MRSTLIALACTATLGLPCAMAGTVDVKFTKPETYSDVRDNLLRRDDVIAAFAEHFKTYGKRLPEGQTLAIEVLDIDLAGDAFPRTARDIRVLRGRADWPRMQLRYSLSENGRVLRSGEDNVSDMNYLMDSVRFQQGPYPYETRMLDRWFDERFVKQVASR